MASCLCVLVDPVVKHGDVIRVGETAVLRTPTGACPHQAILQQGLKYQPRNLAVGHESFLVLF